MDVDKTEHQYKICWRVPHLMGMLREWTHVEKDTYDTEEQAHEAMKSLGEKMCHDLETTCATKFMQHRYKLVEPSDLANLPTVCRCVIVSENMYTFEACPVGYLQVFEV